LSSYLKALIWFFPTTLSVLITVSFAVLDLRGG